MLSREAFAGLFPSIPARLQQTYQDAMDTACAEFQVNTQAREAAFLAQCGHETGGLQWLEELGGPIYFEAMYEHRADLGNTQPGDGALYHGRGMLQLTGRANYRTVGAALNLPLEEYPSIAADVAPAARIAGYYWKNHGCNELADVDDFVGITKKINGGLNGLDDRKRRWDAARTALGLPLIGEVV